MKRLIACVSLVAVATTAAVSSAAGPPHPAPGPGTTAPAKAAPAKPAPKQNAVAAKAPKCRVAPADEYFGKLKMSILGIRNTIRDQGQKVDYYPDKADSTLNAIALAEDAIHDWQHKYPCDSWLPGSIYALEHFYAKLHTADGVKHVHATYAWLRHDFPRDRIVAVALKEDGSAVIASPNPVAAGPGSTTATATTDGDGTARVLNAGAAGAAPAGAPTAQPGIIPTQSLATPVPGTAPASVINAESAPSPAATASP